MIKEHVAWLEDYLRPLVGAEIVGVDVHVEDEYEAWPRLTVRLRNGTKLTLEVSRDEEGNGPGFLFGLPIPETKDNQ